MPGTFLGNFHLIFYQEAKLATNFKPICKADISLPVCTVSANGILQILTLPTLFTFLEWLFHSNLSQNDNKKKKNFKIQNRKQSLLFIIIWFHFSPTSFMCSFSTFHNTQPSSDIIICGNLPHEFSKIVLIHDAVNIGNISQEIF